MSSSTNALLIMISVDSITIAVPRELVDVVSTNFSSTTAPDGSLIKMVAKPECIGINTIEVKPDIVRFDVSAKILLEQYSSGININTIERVFDMLNKTNIIKLNSNDLSDYKVHKCDFVGNFITDKPHQDYYNALNIIYNPRYRNAMYEKSCKTGFAFIGQQSSRNKYMKFYDKLKELHQSCNKRFVGVVGMHNLANYFEDAIRIEFRAITHQQIRTYSGIDSNSLHSLLLSNDNPLYKIFCEILRGNKMKINESLLVENITTNRELENMLLYLGCKTWLSNFDDDVCSALSPIKQILKAKEKHKSHTSRALKVYKDKFQEVLSNEINQTATIPNSAIDNVEEIKTFLLSCTQGFS
jgi:hypothetical protein